MKTIAIIGAGPAGNSCATAAARRGAEVLLIERCLLGGESHRLDCIPSKAMISLTQNCSQKDKPLSANDLNQLGEKVESIGKQLGSNLSQLIKSQGIEVIYGAAQLKGKNELVIDTGEKLISREADAIVLATGSRPRVPDWYKPDGEKILLTRDVYPPPETPEHIVIIGSGVTGVEMTHLFSSLGSQVTLLVSRQHVLPDKDPEVAAILEEDFEARRINLLKGARASDLNKNSDGSLTVQCEDGRRISASHVLLAIGNLPNSENLGLDNAGIETNGGHVLVDHHLRTNIPNIYAAGDLVGKLHLSSVAITQGKKIAEHAMGLNVDLEHRHIDYDKAPLAIFTDPEIADVGLAEVDAFSEGRKVRVTKVPFFVSARALIQGDTRGFVKIISDPATGEVLGGSIVGRYASEMIGLVSLAVNSSLKVTDLAESMSVHPSLVEVVFEAAE